MLQNNTDSASRRLLVNEGLAPVEYYEVKLLEFLLTAFNE